MDPYRIVIADDHTLFRQSLKRILKENPNFIVIGEAGDGLELLDFLKMSQLSPHLAILDISMPNLSGIEAIPKIRMIYPDIKILILTIHKEQEFLCQAISSGANGYLLKEDTDIELFKAIETIQKGGVYVSSILSGSCGNGGSST